MNRRETPYPPGERISVSWRATAELNGWIDAQAEASGRSKSQQIELMLQRAADAERDFYGSATLAFGQNNSGIVLLLGLVMSDAETNAIEIGHDHPDAAAVAAAVMARTLSILLDVEIVVGRPPGVSRDTWEMRIDNVLRPLKRLRDCLNGDPGSPPPRLIDQLVIDRLTDAQKARIAAMPTSRSD
jgi:hypothetical protein